MEGKFINFDPVTVLQSLYQIKAEQDGAQVKIIVKKKEKIAKAASVMLLATLAIG